MLTLLIDSVHVQINKTNCVAVQRAELNDLQRKFPEDLWKEDLAVFIEELDVSFLLCVSLCSFLTSVVACYTNKVKESTVHIAPSLCAVTGLFPVAALPFFLYLYYYIITLFLFSHFL